MKINKGMTLEQFIDLVTSNTGDSEQYYTNKDVIRIANEKNCSCGDVIAVLISNYNTRLKQPLTKEMFVNICEKPDPDNDYFRDANRLNYELFNTCSKKWQEAERKVIFKGWKLTGDFKSCNSSEPSAYLYHEETKMTLFIDELYQWSLGDLFEVNLKGWELQNFEIFKPRS